MTLLELVKNDLNEADRNLTALLDFQKTDDEIIQDLIGAGKVGFKNPENNENQEV